VNIIEKGLNQGEYVLGVFCDISGAFDNVLHSSITSAMSQRGIDNTIIKWYDHFLKSRTIKSTLGGTEAAIRPGKVAPQGGVLSAIISWNLVFDDFLKMYHNAAIKSIGFADNRTLLITGICINTIYDIKQKALHHAENWAAENGLKFCPKKTNAILFTRKHIKVDSLPHLKMYGQQVPNVKETKMLGVVIDSKLNWTLHITQKIAACKKAPMMLRPLIWRTWRPKPIYTRLLYEGVIIPMLTYGSAVWGHAAQKSTICEKLLKLQRLGLTAITYVRQGTPTMGLELIYDLPPLNLRIKECALGTFLRLGELQEVAWIPKSKSKIGHLRWLRQQLPRTIYDDVITTVTNITIPYCVLIDTTLLPAAADICLYTDGSLLEEQSGAGVYIEVDWQPQVTMSKRLQPCTVFQSELRAIQMACEHLCLHGHNNKDLHIHVDSQAALQSLVKLQITSKTVRQTVELLRELAVRHAVTLQ
jgi:ribonuclease HI